MRSKKLWIASAIATVCSTVVSAQQMGIPAASLPMMVQGVGIDQNLNAQIPLELTFKDDSGQVVRLGQYFREKPVVLALVYYECPGLCDLILNGLTHAMEQISLNVGSDYEVVTVSFNPRETWQLANAKKSNYIEKYKRPAALANTKAGWHFLVGDQASIKSLADTVGFHYNYDPISKQFAHASGIFLLTPEGKIARYFYGIDYKPRDFRLGLVEASANKIGSTADQVLLFCYHYDPMTGKYGMTIKRVTQVLGTATALGLFGFVFIMLRRERHSYNDARRSA
jgi:protein SCO1/2